jgi:hypothetical protein
MPWFAAHAVMYLKLKDEPQHDFLVWENVLLVEASSAAEAETKAAALARDGEGDSQGTLTYGDKPGTWVFAGLRKIISVAHRGVAGRLSSGDEATYSEYRVADLPSVMKLAAGEAVDIEYVE